MNTSNFAHCQPQPRVHDPTWPPALVLTTAFLAGFAVTVIEFTAVRFFAPFFGQSNLIWTNIIGVVLLALASGYVLGGRVADRSRTPAPLLCMLTGAALFTLAVPAVGVRIARALVPDGFPAGPNLAISFYASLTGAFVLFAVPVALLGAVGPFLIRLGMRPGRSGRVSGLVFGVSTVGSILGCYATTLLLIPSVGVRATLVFAGGTLLTVTIVGALAGALPRPGRSIRTSAIVAILLSTTTAAMIPAAELTLRGGGLPGDTLLLEEESGYQTIRVLERHDYDPIRGEPVTTRLLALDEGDGEYHSVTIPGRFDTAGRYFDYLAMLPFIAGPETGPYRVLVVGFAGGSLYRVLRHLLGDRLSVTGVEIDPRVVEAAYRFLELPRDAPGLTLIVEDGRAYVNALPPRPTFDLIVVDAYTDQTYLPFQVASREFFALTKPLLRPGGLLAVNVDCRTTAATLVRTIGATVDAAGFAASWILPVPHYPSALLLARPDSSEPLRLRASLPQPWAETALVAPRLMFGYARRGDDVVLTDDLAPVERIIDQTLR